MLVGPLALDDRRPEAGSRARGVESSTVAPLWRDSLVARNVKQFLGHRGARGHGPRAHGLTDVRFLEACSFQLASFPPLTSYLVLLGFPLASYLSTLNS